MPREECVFIFRILDFSMTYNGGKGGGSGFWENYTMRKCIGSIWRRAGRVFGVPAPIGRPGGLQHGQRGRSVRRIADLFHIPGTSPRTTMFGLLYAVHYKISTGITEELIRTRRNA